MRHSVKKITAGAVLLFAFLAGSPPAVCAQTASASQSEELFLVAQNAYDDGFYDVAIRYLEQFVRAYPEHRRRIQARLLLGQCYFYKNQYLKAFEIFQKLEGADELQDAVFYWLGETYFKASDFRKAKSYYLKVIEDHPDSLYKPQALYSLGWTLFEEGKFEEARTHFQQLADTYPDHELTEDVVFKLGEIAQNLDENEEAVAYFQRHLYQFPDSQKKAEAHFYLAENYYFLDDYLRAVTFYAKAADLAEEPRIQFISTVSMAWSYLKLEKHDLARKYFEKAAELAERHEFNAGDVYFGLASLYTQTQQWDEAYQIYSRLIRDYSDTPRINEAYLGKATIDYLRGNFKEAVAQYRALIGRYEEKGPIDETLQKAYYGLAWTHLKSGDPAAAIESFKTIMDRSDSKIVKASALTQIGDAYQEMNNYQKALEIYDQILKRYPDSLYTDYAQFRQGIALLRMNQFQAASLSFQALEANFPNSKYAEEVPYYLGLTSFKREQWPQAVQHLLKFLEINDRSDPLVPEARYLLGLSYFNNNDFEKAAEAFTRIQRLHPDKEPMYSLAGLNIAKSLYQQKKIKEALQAFKDLDQKYPESEVAQEALLWLGDHHFEEGDYQSALSYYQDFIRRFPGSKKTPAVHFELGQTFQVLEQFDRALESYRRIGEADDPKLYAKAQLAVADIFSRDQDATAAIENYQAIIDKVPDFQRDAYSKIADIYQDRREYQRAVENYQKALETPRGSSKLTDAELRFRIADTYEVLAKKEKAVEQYLMIPYLHPGEGEWITRAYLRIARIFEEQEDWDEALLTYQKIAALETDEAKYAQERIDWIKQNIENKKR